uniref:RimK family alpha-L-glutamate ligase n=1 Tax=Archaeoglobus fulgidus TaxID=2234 RepID=A0A7C3RMY3_ARCFL
MKIACFAESYNFKFKEERQALEIFKMTAEKLGHSFTILGDEILRRIEEFDSVFIRATTDPLFTSYVVSRLAEEMGKKVIDDSESIRICSNKVALYYRLKRNFVPTPKTIPFHGDFENLESYANELGYPLVVKSPNSRFSLYVEKANNYGELIKIVRRYMRKSKALILQEYMPSAFDWRIGVLGGEVIYACKYFMSKGGWKINDSVEGKKVWGKVKAVKVENLPSRLRKIAVMAAKSVGNGLYGVDIKEINGNYYVIEVNDNPTIMHGDEDAKNPELYEKIIQALVS